MKKLLIASIFSASMISGFSQRINIESGQSISNIAFEDRAGNKIANVAADANSYLKLGYSQSILTQGLNLNGLLCYNRYGATASDRILNNYYNWDLSYLGLNIGLGYDILKSGDFTFSVLGEASSEFLMQGKQTINNQVYKLQGEEDFDSPIYMFRGGMSIDYKVTNIISLYTAYTYGGGSPFKKTANKFNYNVHNIGVGIRINIKEKGKEPAYANNQIQQLYKELDATKQKLGSLEKLAGEVDELERRLIIKEKEMADLKDTISDVLFNYEDKELSVNLKEGKVYITLENDLLFKSGSYKMQQEGKDAVSAIAGILNDNPQMNILIEGHTDDLDYRSNGVVDSNWDLSAKRACAIVDVLLENKNINPQNITVAGRAEYAPVADNSTPEGRAKNRRIEVIIFPPLDKLSELLNH